MVESPAKAKTIGRILGREYSVRASMGHIRDLPRKALGIDVEHGFRPRYVIAPRKKQTIERLRSAARDADVLYLATDLDREGEAIAWHVLQVLSRVLPKGTEVRRVTFHEITKGAIEQAFRRPGSLNQSLVEAQHTRRILDRLVGYSISPLLWRRIRGVKGLSAGRVQTAALRLVVDREREIEAFVPVEYWSIEALLAQQIDDPQPFRAQLWRIYDEHGVAQAPDLKHREDAQAIVDALEGAAYWVDRTEVRQRTRRPWPPFTTSTMQQAAAKALGYPPQLTMRIAQQLYEGVDLGAEGTVGLITYMRTDSTAVSVEAQQAAREVIARYWGERYLPAQAPEYKTRVKSAQEAHEAIRPTDPHRAPRQVREHLDDRQARLYELVWRRFIASQMAPALYEVTTAYIPTTRDTRTSPLPYLFRAQGRVCLFDGFLRVYEEVADVGDEGENAQALPALSAGEALDLLELIPEQHWTQPPPRYTEASLIKELERRGIGRPSTFAAMVALILDRAYVHRQGKALAPTELGFAVCDMLVAAFPDLFEYGFTARMEDQLDDIANGRAERVSTLQRFWAGLEPALARASEVMPRIEIAREAPQPTGRTCPECGGALVRRKGKHGAFVGCANYPQCTYVERRRQSTPTGEVCPVCGGALILRRGRHGAFLGCSNYPTCRYTAKAPASKGERPASAPDTG
ncbi:MAG: type I DNA topoisomerase [Anaerolineae bacterium]|nr:type I DNA topoisomerase [Anaerolineae bacterium]